MKTACPSERDLRALLSGEALPAGAEEALAGHADSCPDCLRRLESLTWVGDAESGFETSSGLLRLRGLLPAIAIEPGAEAPGAADPGRDWPAFPGYQAVGVLGRGGMGVVYEARDHRLSRTVAIKQLLNLDHADPADLLRFRLEGELLARLEHPNIVRIHELVTEGRRAYIVLEFVELGSLDRFLKRESLSAGQAAELVETLALAIDHAHRHGVIHRDLKPANILLAPPGPEVSTGTSSFSGGGPSLPWSPKVTDFGLAKRLDSDLRLTETGVLAGTPGYMAPEQMRQGLDRLLPATDVYALGAILYECLAGRPPHLAETAVATARLVAEAEPTPPHRLRPGIPRDLETICLKCLEKDPARRYPTATALAEELRRFLDGRPIRGRRAGGPERAWKWVRRNPVVAGLVAAVFLSMLVGTVFSAHFALKARRRAEIARDAESRAVAARRESDQLAATLLLDAGLSQAGEGQVARGLFSMLDAWRRSPVDASEFRRVARMNLDAWADQLAIQTRVGVWGEPGPRAYWLVDGEGRTVVSIDGDALRRWDAETGLPIGLPAELPEPLLSSWKREFPGIGRGALSADGAILALISGDKYHLLDTATGRAIADPFSAPGEDKCEFFAADQILATYSQRSAQSDYDVHLRDLSGHDLREATLTVPWDAYTHPPTYGARTPEGRLLAVRGEAGGAGRRVGGPRLRFLDLFTGEDVEAPSRIDPADRAFLWADGLGLTAYYPNILRVWDTADGRAIGEPWSPNRSDLISITADGQSAHALGPDRRVRLYDLDTGLQRGGDIVVDDRSQFDTVQVHVSGDGSKVRVFRGDGAVRVWEFGRPRLQRTPAANPWVRPTPEAIASPEFDRAAFAPGLGSALLGRSNADQGRLVDVATRRPFGTPLRGEVALPTFSPDGRLLATASRSDRDPWLRIWDAETGESLAPPLELDKLVYTLSFSPDSRTLAVGCVGVTFLVDAESGQVRHRLPETTVSSRMAFSPDGRRLAIGYRGGWAGVGPGLRVWDVATGRPAGPFLPWSDESMSAGSISCKLIAFEGDGRRLIAVSPDRLWDCDGDTGVPLGTPSSLGLVERAALSPDGSRLLTVAPGGSVQQWETSSLRQTGPQISQGGRIEDLLHSPDGKTLAIALADHSIELRDTGTGLPIGPPLQARAKVLQLAFTPDGRSLVAALSTGTIREWDLPTPVADDPDRMDLWLKVASGFELAEDRLRLLDGPAWNRLREEFVARWPDQDPWTAADEAGRHNERALEAEGSGNTHAALWHLDRLARLQPDDWTIQARRCAILTALGDDERALAACEQAMRSARARDDEAAAIDWFRHTEALRGSAN